MATWRIVVQRELAANPGAAPEIRKYPFYAHHRCLNRLEAAAVSDPGETLTLTLRPRSFGASWLSCGGGQIASDTPVAGSGAPRFSLQTTERRVPGTATFRIIMQPRLAKLQCLSRMRAASLRFAFVTCFGRTVATGPAPIQPNASKLKWQAMRKRHVSETRDAVPPMVESWLDLDRIATVEITSEDDDHPIERAIGLIDVGAWRAAEPGEQTIRLVFDRPQTLKRISLEFEEHEKTRTQEFLLRWSSDSGKTFREIVRQQWNFSPPATTREAEDYQVELSNVTVLELLIVPDVSGEAARASLTALRMN